MLLYGRNVTSNLPRRQVIRDLDQLISEFLPSQKYIQMLLCYWESIVFYFKWLKKKKKKETESGQGKETKT